MNESKSNDSAGEMPEGLPPEQRANLEHVRAAREAASRPPTRGGGLRFALRKAPAPALEPGVLGTTVPATKTRGLSTIGLQFIPAAADVDDASNDWQAIGTVDLFKSMGSDPEWVDLLCIARQCHKHSVLPILLEDAPPAAEDSNAGELERSQLVLEEVQGLEVTAQQLRAAFAKKGAVMGAYTPAGLGMFVALVFDLS